jgi:ParB family transcriptional regulator, chromosome partitioning protein
MNGSQSKNLGRGFNALLPQDFDRSLLLTPQDKVQELPASRLRPNPHQPRKHFDEEALEELAVSIKQYGVVQPLIVTPTGGGNYNIIVGERRFRASKIAGLERVPVLVRSSEELEQLEISIIENVQRVDLSPLEQAVSIERLHEQFNFSYEEIARRLGKATSTVINTVRLLQLPAEAQQALRHKDISEGHARSILALKNQPDKQAQLLAAIKKHGWSVRQAERYVTSHKEGVKDEKLVRQRVYTETPATRALGKRLGTPVHIRRTAKGGKLEITFSSDEELDKIIQRLK